MEKEKLEFVLTEILEEIRMQNTSLDAIRTTVQKQGEQIEDFERHLNQQTVNVVSDLKPVEDKIAEGITLMRAAAFHPDKMIKEYRLSLFKSNNSVEYYRTLFMWAAIITTIILGYVLIRHWMDLSYRI